MAPGSFFVTSKKHCTASSEETDPVISTDTKGTLLLLQLLLQATFKYQVHLNLQIIMFIICYCWFSSYFALVLSDREFFQDRKSVV